MVKQAMIAAWMVSALGVPAYAAEPLVTKITPAATTPASPIPGDYKVLEVNGQPIMKSFVIKVWNSLFPEGKAPDFETFNNQVKMNVLRGIVSEQVIYAQAQKSGIEATPAVQEKLEALRKRVITQAFLDQQLGSRITDADLEKAYQERLKQYQGKREVHASHILVSSEEAARDAVKQLKAGKDFNTLASELSEDKASAAKGGDLGWFTEDRMVPEFSKAAFALKKGEISMPVKTDFGWHVIKVLETRDIQVPTLEESKDSLREEMRDKVLKKYVDDLVDNTPVKYFDASGQALEFEKAAAKP